LFAAVAGCVVDPSQGIGPAGNRTIPSTKPAGQTATETPPGQSTPAPGASKSPGSGLGGGVVNDDDATTSIPVARPSATVETPTPSPSPTRTLAPTPPPTPTPEPTPRAVSKVVLSPFALDLYAPAPDGSNLPAYPASGAFAATVTYLDGATDSAVTWSVNKPTEATVSVSGLVRLLAGATGPIQVRATSTADGATSGVASVFVLRKSQFDLEIE
jgi:hypothetical protein